MLLAPRPPKNLSLCTVAPQNLNRRIRHSTLRGRWCGGGCVSQRPSSLSSFTPHPLCSVWTDQGPWHCESSKQAFVLCLPHSPTSIHTVASWFRYISTSENGCLLFASFSCYTVFDLLLCWPRVVIMLFLCHCWLYFPCYAHVPPPFMPYVQAQH